VRREYFEDMYAADPDPWGFETRWYEQRKYALTLASLTRDRYRSVFEPGCSIGVLSAGLAARCERLLACDLVDSAVEQARVRLDGLSGAHAATEVRQWDAHDAWPAGPFDLVLVSEMLYYLEADDAAAFMRAAVEHLTEDGEIVLVHWRQKVPEYPLTGDEAHEIACATAGLTVVAHYEDDDLRLDVLSRTGRPSVADREGLRG
jgi:cyclopropane fatty-acyl-phospholipid synthase-like methyltransferase